MRVTQNITTNNFINSIHKQTESLLKVQKQISSQKRINKISDDPIGMGHVLGYRSNLAVIDQYEKNITQGITRLKINESTLDFAAELVDLAKRIAEDNSGSGVSLEERQVAAYQVGELNDQILQLANSKFEGNYIFSGHATDKPAFLPNGIYDGDTGKARIMIAENVEIKIDANGSNIFGPIGGVDLFSDLQELIAGLGDADLAAGSVRIKATIDPLFNAREQINNKRTEYASIFYRLEATQDYWSNLKPKVNEALASTEEVDLIQAVLELKNLELAYETTLAAAARIIQPTLMDFLR
jgi:flagellar hook-associated protein 3 FlgL